MNKYEPVIGLEIHVQLRTKSKMFCSCDNTGENQPANTTICPICLGHPGTLPSVNGQAVRWAVMAALALKCELNTQTHFDRKSYFYPDLPKGYQISQFAAPVGHDGHLVVYSNTGKRRVRIERVHMEEDTAKLLHDAGNGSSYVDYNRAGTPLLEIVTRPDLQTPQEAKAFLQELRLVMRYLNISDADMEKGHLRCDANVSLRPNPEYFQDKSDQAGIGLDPAKLYPKTEVKNLNSFRAVERAVEYEIKRQTGLWDKGEAPTGESTRGWDDREQETVLQREKEAQHDYRYFPEPDIPPITLDKKFIAEATQSVVELPYEKRERFIEQFGLGAYDVGILVADKQLAAYFEQVVSELRAWLIALENVEGTEEEIWAQHKQKLVKMVANWMISRLLNLVNESGKGISDISITPENFAELMTLIYQRKVNNQTAVAILAKMFVSGKDPSDIMDEEQLGGEHGAFDLGKLIDQVLAKHDDVVAEYRSGKTVTLQYLIGQVMKASKGKADPDQVRDALVKKLK